MVEWKKLISVTDVLYGYPFESSLFSEDSCYIPLIRIRDVKPGKARHQSPSPHHERGAQYTVSQKPFV
jgi:hypothetical protein